MPTPTSPNVYATASVSATIGGAPAAVSFAGLAPGFVSLVQANIVVPPSLAAGTYPLVVSIDGQASNAGNVSVR
jgi:adhesin/invasin